MRKFLKITRIILMAVFNIPSYILAFLAIIFYWFFRLFGMKKTAEKAAHFLCYLVCLWIMFSIGGKVHIEGRENLPQKSRSVVYAPNHNSLIDVPLFYMALGHFPSMMAKKELFKVPILHGLLVALSCIKIDRKGAHSIVEAVRSGVKMIENGHSIVIFPEGTRSKTGEIGTFKNGAFKIAERTDCAVVPVVIKNDRYLLESAHNLKRIDVYIKFLTPIETSGLNEEEKKNLAPMVEALIKEEWAKLPEEKKRV